MLAQSPAQKKCKNEVRVKLQVTQEKMALSIAMFSGGRQPTCVVPIGRSLRIIFPICFSSFRFSILAHHWCSSTRSQRAWESYRQKPCVSMSWIKVRIGKVGSSCWQTWYLSNLVTANSCLKARHLLSMSSYDEGGNEPSAVSDKGNNWFMKVVLIA